MNLKKRSQFNGHTDWVLSTCFSSDDRYVVSGSRDMSVRVWDLEKQEEFLKFEGHTGWVSSVCFSSDDRYVVSGSFDMSVRVWDLEKQEEFLKFEGHTDAVRSVCFSSDDRYVVSGSYDGSVRVWDLEKQEEFLKFEGHTDGVRSVCFSSDDRYVVSGSGDMSVRVWDLEKQEEFLKFEGHTGWVSSVCFSSDDRYVVSGSKDKSICVWNLETQNSIHDRFKPLLPQAHDQGLETMEELTQNGYTNDENGSTQFNNKKEVSSNYIKDQIEIKKTHDVYISYTSEDKQIADAICHVIEQNKIKCWTTPRNAIVGEPFVEQIRNAIQDADVFVLVFSIAAQASQFIKNEIHIAFANDKPILLFNLDGMLPQDEMGLYLNSLRWIDAYPEPEKEFGNLVENISNILESNNNGKPNFDVFISYSSENQKTADAICNVLESNKVKCWIAHRDIISSQTWHEEIDKAIKNSKITILVLSKDSSDSNQVKREIMITAEEGNPLLPYKIDDSKLTSKIRYFLIECHWLESYPDPEENFKILVEHTLSLLKNE